MDGCTGEDSSGNCDDTWCNSEEEEESSSWWSIITAPITIIIVIVDIVTNP